VIIIIEPTFPPAIQVSFVRAIL